MKGIQNLAGFLFIAAVAVLSVVSIFGVWEVFSGDVITKSYETMGLLAFVAVIVMAAGHVMENRGQVDGEVISVPSPVFKSIRKFILVVLIIAASLLAFLGVLAIWDVIKDATIVNKTLGSLAILAFGAFVIVMTCLEREKNPMFTNGIHKVIITTTKSE